MFGDQKSLFYTASGSLTLEIHNALGKEKSLDISQQ